MLYLSIILVSSLIALLLVEGILRLFSKRLFYRPHEMLLTYDEDYQLCLYKKNSTVTMLIPHGDLINIDRYADRSIIEPHKITFKVDSYGFRNNSDYNNEKFILVGDSFIISPTVSQEDILSSQLRRTHNIKTYNVAMVGSLCEYVKFIKKFQEKQKGNFKILLFIFEGNDFSLMDRKPLLKTNFAFRENKLYKKIRDFIMESHIFKLIYPAYYNVLNEINYKMTRYHKVKVFRIKNKDIKIGFYDEYIERTKRATYMKEETFYQELKSISDKIEHIFFIPTKYRVYCNLIEKEIEQPLPNAQWEYLNNLAKELNLKCTDLTPPLIEESKKLLKENKFTYYRDDTHWNKYGISVVAKVVYESLQ